MVETRCIFLYWIGSEYKLIKILRNLIYLHSTSGKGYKVILITDKNINDYIKYIPNYFTKLCPAHQADFVRVNVICDYGGIWLDSDTLVLDSLDSLFDFIENKNGFFIRQNNTCIWNGVFGSKPNTPLMIKWRTEMMRILDNNQENIGWCDIGNNLLRNIYNENSTIYDDYNIFDGLDNLYPINYTDCVNEFVVKPYDNYTTIIREYQPLVVLVNSVYKLLEIMTEQDILNGNMPINYFINKSFENKHISKNNLYTNQYIYNYGKTDYISESIIYNKCWEPNISNIFDNIIKNNTKSQSVVFDIGCNIGYFSILCAKNTNISNIFSIDANIDNINILNMSCILNGINKIQPYNLCISDISGQLYTAGNKEFAKNVGNIGGINYIKTTNFIPNDDFISTITIDELINKNSITDIIIMKIDIEGGELNALRGALNTLKTNIIKNIIIEISPTFNNDSADILQILKNNNYNLFNIPHLECGTYNDDTNFVNNICNNHNQIIDIHKFVESIGMQTNIIAIKNINVDIKKYVIYTDWISTYLTLEPFMFVKNLESFGWEIIELSKLNIENIKNNKCIVLCVTYDDFDMSLIKCDNVQIIYKIDDLHPYKEIRNKCIETADIIVSPYQYLFNTTEIKNMYKNINLPKTFYIPYSAVDDFFENIKYNNKPINKIFVSGCVDDRYPLRHFIKFDNKFKQYIDSLDHPSYSNYSHNCINTVYYNKLNEYLCCFVDASAYKYILLKIFEICSVGSLLLVDDIIENELNILGFYNNINCIFCNKNNLEDKIKWILNNENRQLVDNMRKLGLELVRNKHATSNRSEQFNIIVENINSKRHFCEYNNDKYFTFDKIQVEYINNGTAEPYSGNIDIVNNYIKSTNRNNLYIDVGVNIATHSIVFSKLFTNVIAFEPNIINYTQSKENIIINNKTNIKLYNKALGYEHKKISTKQHSTHSLGCTYIVEGTDTDCITLDSMNLTYVDYIKFDIEGFELYALKGAINTIKQNSPIIEIEYNSCALNLFNIKYEDIELFLHNLDYTFDKRFEDNYFFIKNNNKTIFDNIYKNQIWNNGDTNIPLSGPGSSLENTKECSELLNKFIYENNCNSVLDLGCGDLTWITKTPFFNDTNIKYIGVDIVEQLIHSHSITYPNKSFLCKDLVQYNDMSFAPIIIIRDVIFHLKNEEILNIFNNIKNKFKFLLITSCKNQLNTDIFDRWHFSEKNINIEPFNKSQQYHIKINEQVFNRYVYIYEHDCFYNL